MINFQNIDDNQCFKQSIVRYLNPASHHSGRITKTHKNLTKKHDFKDITFLVIPKITEIHKIEKKKKNSISISIFGYGNKENIQSVYQKNVVKKNMLIYY